MNLYSPLLPKRRNQVVWNEDKVKRTEASLVSGEEVFVLMVADHCKSLLELSSLG